MEEKVVQPHTYKERKPVIALVLIWLFCAIVPIVLALCKVPTVVLCIVFVLTALLFSIVYVILISRPITKLGKYVSTISNGDFAERITVPIGFSDMKELCAELDVFINSTLNELMYDLKMQILHTQDTSNAFLMKVQDAVTNSSRISLGADYIRERVENLQELADGNEKENALIRQSISEYRELVQKQSDEVERTGKTLDEIIASLKVSVKKLDEKKVLSTKLSSVTQDVSVKVKDTAAAVEKISDNLDLLHNTIKVIASVANRTNLLAMNASIEAAHAGSAGAGFAVVAEEIRKLSEQTSTQVKTITESLKVMTDTIEKAVASSRETGSAFEQINLQIENYVETFDHVIDDYTEAGHKNESIAEGYESIRGVESSLSKEVEKIDASIKKNSDKLAGINSCITEISNIVDRNTHEALELSRSQDPIYTNAVINGKNLETIRRRIDIFRLSSVPLDIWTADKKELWTVIQALFDHLDWTVMLLDYLHGKSAAVKSQIVKGTTSFDKWLYGEEGKKYTWHESMPIILELDSEIHEKAAILVRLRDAGKEQEATIEFSEVLELSRKMVVELNKIKTYLVKNLTKQNNPLKNAATVPETHDMQLEDMETANKAFIDAKEKMNTSKTDEAEELEEI